MRTVIITGAYGFLGRNTALKFKENGYIVYGCGHGSWNKDEKEQWGISKWVEGDISIQLLMQFSIQPDVIVHCAGSGSVALSLNDPASDFHKTVSSILSVLDFIRKHSKGTRLIYPSSAAVYGEHIDAPISINDPQNPSSPYGVHKKIAEELCISYQNYFNVKSSIVRFFSVYGPGLQKQLLWDACNKLSQKDKNVEFWGTGDETRDWIYISDAVELVYRNATSSDVVPLMNGGTAKKHSIKETLSILAKELDLENTYIGFNNVVRAGDPRFYLADMTEAIEVEWSAKVELPEGIKKYVAWFKSQYHD